MAASAGFVSVPVIPTFAGMSKEFAAKLEAPAKQSGERAGKAMSAPLDGAVANLEKQFKASSGKLDQLDRAHQKSVSKRDQQQDKLEASTLRLEDAENKYKEAIEKGDSGLKELAKVKDEKAKVTKATDDLEQAEIDVTVAERKHKDQLDDLEATSGKLTEAQNELAESTDGSGKSFAEASEESERFGKAMDGVALGIVGMATGAVAGLASIGSDFQEMSRTIAVGSGATGDALRDLEESAMDVATNVPVPFDEAANAIAGLNTMTGESGPALERLSEQVLNASNLLGEDGVSNANDFGNALSQWEIDAADGADALDGLFAVTQNYGIGLGEVTGHLNTFGSVLNNAGFSMEESAVLFGSLEKSGLSVSRIMPGLNSAFRGWAEEGLNVQETLADTVGQIESAETAQEALALATEEFGAEGAQRLTTAIRNGSFALEDFDTALGDTSGVIDQTAEDNRTLGESFELFKNEALVAIEPIATELIDWLIPAMESMVGQLEDALDWISENKELIKGLAVGVGVAAAAFVTWRGSVLAINGAMKIFQLATALSTTGVRGLNTAMKANIFGLIATAIAGLAAGLVYFFTQTETGQEMWEKFTTALADGWDWVVEKLSAGWEWLQENVFNPLMIFVTETLQPIWESVVGFLVEAWDRLVEGISWAYENIFEPVFNAILTVAQVTLAVIGTAILAPLMITWNLLSAAIEWAWENVIHPVWSAISSFATETLWPALESVFTFIGDAWSALGDGIQWVYDNVIKPAWDALAAALQWLWETVIMFYFGLITSAWQALGDGIRWVYDNVIKPAWDALGNALTWMYGNIIQPTLQWIGDRWDDMAGVLEAGWHWIRDNVFDPLGRGLETVQGWFQTGVEAIKDIWHGLREAAAAPVRFVVNTVWNNGILKAIEAVTKFLPGLDAPDPVRIGFDRGGILPGFSRMRDGDDQLVPMRRGEGVLVSEGLQDEQSRKLFMSANESAKRGTSFAAFMSDYVSGYANGGIIGSLNSIMREFYPELSLTSGLRPGDSGYHGSGQAADFSNTGSGMPSTPAMQSAAAFMFGNYGDQLEQLIHHPARNIGSGMDVGDGFGYYGSGTMYGHTDHIHLAALRALVDPTGVVQMMPYDGEGGGGFSLMGVVKSAWDAVINKINPFSGEGNGSWFSQIPGEFLSTAAGKMWEFVAGKIGSGSYDGAGGLSGNVESWREMAMAAMRRNGFNADDPAQVNAMLAQIQSESSGNPSAVQGIVDVNSGGNEAAGLLQVIPGTFAANRDPSLPDDRMDPWANMNAALRYYRGRYGDDLTTMWGQGHGYAEGGIVDLSSLLVRDFGGLVPHGAAAINTSGRDEMMLPPETTALLNQFFAEFPEVAQALVDATTNLENAAHWLEQAASPHTEEGVTARQSARRFLDLGLDIPGAELITSLLDAESSLLDARGQQIGHLNAIAEAQREYDEALRAHSSMLEAGTTEDGAEKLKAAQEKVDAAEGDERVKAEEGLAKVREEVAASSAEALTESATSVADAEQALADARMAQVQDLDHIVVLSQQNVADWGAQANQFGGQLVQMGVSASMVSQGLGAVSGALGAVSAAAGPAGITLGMAFQALQLVIQIVQIIDGLMKEWLAKIAQVKIAQLEAMNDYLGNISQVTSAIHAQRSAVVDLTATVLDAFIRMGDAARGLAAASAGVFKAGLDGAKNIADIQKQIRDLRSQGSGGGAVSSPIPWDMGLMYDSYSNELTASPKVKPTSTEASLSDVVSEIAALNWDLQAALVDQQIMIKQAQLDQIRAEFEVLRSQLNLDRAFHDLTQGVDRLILLGEIQTELAITEQQARIQQDINQLLIENAQSEQVQNDLMNKIGSALDFDGDGKVFGIFDNLGSKATQAAESSITANNKQIEALGQIMESYGGSAQVSPEAIKAADDVAYFMKEGRDDLAGMAKNGSPLGDAVRSTQLTTLMQDLWSIDDRNEDSRRALEDLGVDFEEYLSTQPLQDEIDQMTHARDAHTAQAEAIRATSEDVRSAAEALRDFHHEAANREPQVITVNVPASGQTIDADDLARTLDSFGTDISGLDFRVQRVESMNAPKSKAVLATKR